MVTFCIAMWENVGELIGKSFANFVIYDTPATKLVYLNFQTFILHKKSLAQHKSVLGPKLSSNWCYLFLLEKWNGIAMLTLIGVVW